MPTFQFARVSAAAGAFFWLIALWIKTADSSETELIQKIFLLGIFVIVPLALSLVSAKESLVSLRLAVWAQPLAAAICFISFLFPQGFAAGILASVWLALTALVALAGALRVVLSNQITGADLTISAGMVYLPIGGAWLVASRVGLQPLGFGDTIVLLTAVHFHFAGFAAPILTGLTASWLNDRKSNQRIVLVAGIAIILGMPLVATGITLSPKLALAGSLLITIGLFLLGLAVLLWIVPRINGWFSRVLLVVSSLSAIAAMLLACAYAYSIVTHTLIIDIPRMAVTHGLLNSFGFSLCGLLAWSFVASDLAKR